ncbi:MAG: CRISPR-associated protein Csx10 [Acidobacteriota bacterium]|nr:CRISPR-associated protein Csx10 [Acidobacteriota bacterium]
MKVFKITLTQHSPACFASTRHSQNIYYTHDYIPGSVLWGAFINLFHQSGGPDIHPDFLNDNLRFSNCYIDVPGKSKSFAVIPAPLSLYTCKTNPYSPRDGKNMGHELVDLLFRHRDNCRIETCNSALRPLNTGYIYDAGSGKPGLYRPNKMVEMHNRIDKATQNTRQEHGLFAYELLDETGGIFSGEIQVMETSPLLEFIRDIKCRDLELGKARTSGCGHFTLNIEETNGSDRVCFFRTGFQDTLNLYCFSDVIVMDGFNRYQTVITPGILGLEQYIEMDNAFSRGFRVEGYNAKHNKPKINDIAILKGSCFSYRVKEGAVKEEAGREFIAQRLKHIEMNGLGLRLNEGFGRVRFNRGEFKEDHDGTLLEK